MRVERAVGAEQMVLPDDLVQRARPQPVSQRARAGGSFRLGRRAEHVVLGGGS